MNSTVWIRLVTYLSIRKASLSMSIDSFPCYMSDDRMVTSLRLDLTLCYGPPHKLLWVFPGSKIQPEVLAV